MERVEVLQTSKLNDYFSPIERLPPEILQKILAQIGEDFERTFLSDVLAEGIADLFYTDMLNLLLVSKRWYQAATVVSALWTCLPTHAPSEAIDTFIQRSGERPLYLFIDTTPCKWTPRSADKQRQLLHILHRVKGFLWQQTEAPDESELDDEPQQDGPGAVSLSVVDIYAILSAVEAPLLEELHLNLESFDEDVDSFLPSLFAGPPPRLRVLRIYEQNIAPSNHLLQCHLTRLSLMDVCDIWRDGSDMANTFSQLPYLEDIELGAASGLSVFTSEQPADAFIPGQRSVTSLPRLSSFDVTDKVPCIAVMLFFIAFPLPCLIRIEARGESNVGDLTKEQMLRGLVQSLNYHYQAAIQSDMSFRAAHALLRERRDDRLWIQTSHLCKPEESPFYPGRVDLEDPDLVLGHVVKNAKLTLGIVWDLPDVPSVSTARVVFAELSVLRGLEGLSLSTPSSSSPQYLPDFLPHFPRFDAIIAGQSHIRWLELTHYPACAFVQMTADLASLLYPQLEIICIKNAAFTPIPDYEHKMPDALDVARLETYLAARAHSGHLRMFYTRKCIIDDTALVERLRAAVGQDRWGWDGKTLGWS